MTRRADLRRRRDDEYKTRIVDVPRFVGDAVATMVADLRHVSPESMAKSVRLSDDCRLVTVRTDSRYDLVVTSPPYLNGTNYFRNTKLELWYLGFVQHMNELRRYRSQAIAAGINNVSANRRLSRRFESVEKVAGQLDATDGDRRIPALVRHYFSDMFEVFEALRRMISKSSRIILDIGDSRFYGVHVPTDYLLEVVARDAGLRLETHQVLAKRVSRDKSPLVQVELTFVPSS